MFGAVLLAVATLLHLYVFARAASVPATATVLESLGMNWLGALFLTSVCLPGLPATLDGTVVVAMSDMHLGPRLDDRWLAARIEQVRAIRPDLVVLLGDIFEAHGPPPPDLTRRLGTLSARLGVFAVPGNHESRGGRRGNGGLPIEDSGHSDTSSAASTPSWAERTA